MSIKDTVRSMDDATLARKEFELRREIPIAQSLLSAIKRERIRRERKRKKADAQKAPTLQA